ncbi:CehA/McbA family metallohydrolase [Duganella vulcania]|uniref:CehA/McbA family metallohydrolase n=1 Tax=Duganella vulcania TaxID=2692166 RepID=UPI00136E24DC|nr:CehA/McbA family metallohydrolase [Duganella vulcania]
MRAPSISAILFASILCIPAASHATTGDHHEFNAWLEAPFRADALGARTLTLHFSAPDPQAGGTLRWRLTLLSPDGRALRNWRGTRQPDEPAGPVTLRWRTPPTLRNGVYSLRLRASAGDGPTIEQSWNVAVGPAPLASPLTPPAGDTLPYAVYLGNLHSQTSHSDGGGALDHCSGAQPPQSAALGPSDAYAYAQQHGLDFLMTSEHNHMYDGSDGTNSAADPAAAKALYQSGLQAAATWNQAHPAFLAIYGQEWGVINKGGHLNIFNSGELLGWERNAAGELIADTETPKSDYAFLYRLMRERGWFGQFNHPQDDQFAIGGKPLAWNADGDQAMLLCEVMNSSAFSSRSDEGETHLSNFEPACNKLLEAGYHLAFSSDQDNHCANWGSAYSNRTGVLMPPGAPLDAAGLLDALRARRVFATMDKNAQLVLTANGHLMGERIVNSGKLTLQANYASKTGHAMAAITLFQGVPGRNGTVAALSNKPRSVIRPAAGEHFYYARVTQDDGKMLWSAPIWVSQRGRNRALGKIELR